MGRTVYRFSAEKDAVQILLWLSGCCPGCVKGPRSLWYYHFKMAYRHVVKKPQLQARIFLCNWYMKIVRPGREIPENTVQFHVPMDMSKLDIKNYLQSIYNVDVYKVNTRIQHGKTKSIVKNDKLVKKKLPDYKVAYVVLASGTFKFPDLFPREEPKDDKASSTDLPQTSVPFRWF